MKTVGETQNCWAKPVVLVDNEPEQQPKLGVAILHDLQRVRGVLCVHPSGQLRILQRARKLQQ